MIMHGPTQLRTKYALLGVRYAVAWSIRGTPQSLFAFSTLTLGWFTTSTTGGGAQIHFKFGRLQHLWVIHYSIVEKQRLLGWAPSVQLFEKVPYVVFATSVACLQTAIRRSANICQQLLASPPSPAFFEGHCRLWKIYSQSKKQWTLNAVLTGSGSQAGNGFYETEGPHSSYRTTFFLGTCAWCP